MRARFISISILLTICTAASAQEAASLDEVRAAMTGGDYRGALTKLDKLLYPAPQDPAARYELLMLKGECQLQLKDRLGASSAFKSAAKSAGNVNELAAARANALIIDRSSMGTYKPPFTTGGEPIDIMPLDSRKRAMAALQGELLEKNKTQIDAALRAEQLEPIEKIFTQVADMYFLELFSNGQAADAEKLMKELGAHAYKLMQSELTKSANRIDYLTQVANSAGGNARGWDTGRMGLTSQQRNEVKSIGQYLVKIRDRGSEYRRIAAQLGGDAAKWDALVANAVDAVGEAESLFNDR